jgi:hypothetical protein
MSDIVVLENITITSRKQLPIFPGAGPENVRVAADCPLTHQIGLTAND